MTNGVDELIQEALDNIRDDRGTASKFLNVISQQIASDADMNKTLSPVAAKHIETMQRSNEQLVKLIAIKNKNNSETSKLSDDDKNNLFDLIQGEASNGQ
jgi:hypothetical protein